MGAALVLLEGIRAVILQLVEMAAAIILLAGMRAAIVLL
jgi:hypothetical protein